MSQREPQLETFQPSPQQSYCSRTRCQSSPPLESPVLVQSYAHPPAAVTSLLLSLLVTGLTLHTIFLRTTALTLAR